MSNIEAGEYCRTKQGYIAKIIEIRDEYIFDNTIIRSYGEEYDYLHDDEVEEIAKYSKNIIVYFLLFF